MSLRSVDLSRVTAKFDAAIDSLATIGLTEPRDPDRLDVSGVPRPDLLARLLNEIASVWRAQHGDLTQRATATQDIGSPEALVSYAATNDIDVAFENRPVASLTAEDMPAVMLTGDGMGRMLVGRRGRSFVALHGGETYLIDKDALAAEEAGTIFRSEE